MALVTKKKYDEDMAQQRQQLNKQTQLYMAMQDENAQLQAQLDSMKDMLRLEMIKSAAATPTDDGGSDSAASNEMVGALQKEMEQMKARHNSDLDSMLQRMKDKDALVEQAKQEVDQLRKQDKTAALEAKITELEAQVRSLKEAAEKSGQEEMVSSEVHAKATKTLQSLVDKQKKTIGDLEAQLAKESSARMGLEETKEELTVKAKASEEALDTTQKLLDSCEMRVEDLKEQLAKLDEECDASKEELETTQEQVTDLEQKLEEQRQATQQAESTRDAAVVESEAAVARAAEHQKECQELREATDEAQKQLAASLNRIQTQEAMIQELDDAHKDELKGMKISYRRSARLVKSLKKELSRLAKKFSRQEAEIYRLQKTINEFDSVRERLEELERARDEPKDVFGIRKSSSTVSNGSKPSPTHVQNDEVTQELMEKIQNLMIENEEMKLKNSVLQNTVEALSTTTNNNTNNHSNSTHDDQDDSNGEHSPDGSPGDKNRSDRSTSPTEWH